MSRARQIADFGDGIATADIDDGAVTAAKIGSLPAGSVLQVVQTVKTDTFSAAIGGATAVATPTGFSVSITPSSASNKILVFASFNYTAGDFFETNAQLQRNGSAIFVGDADAPRVQRTIMRDQSGGANEARHSSLMFLDSPNTTSATTYSIGIGSDEATTVYFNRAVSNDGATYQSVGASSIIAMEIAG